MMTRLDVDAHALATAEDRVDAMDAKMLATEVARLVDDPGALRSADPVWLTALVRALDFEPRRLPTPLRERFEAAMSRLATPADSPVRSGSPPDVHRSQDPVRFRAKVAELVDTSLEESLALGRDPWMVFAERLTSHLLEVEHTLHAQPPPRRADLGPVRVGEIAEPRVQPPGVRTPAASGLPSSAVLGRQPMRRSM